MECWGFQKRSFVFISRFSFLQHAHYARSPNDNRPTYFIDPDSQSEYHTEPSPNWPQNIHDITLCDSRNALINTSNEGHIQPIGISILDENEGFQWNLDPINPPTQNEIFSGSNGETLWDRIGISTNFGRFRTRLSNGASQIRQYEPCRITTATGDQKDIVSS